MEKHIYMFKNGCTGEVEPIAINPNKVTWHTFDDGYSYSDNHLEYAYASLPMLWAKNDPNLSLEQEPEKNPLKEYYTYVWLRKREGHVYYYFPLPSLWEVMNKEADTLISLLGK